MKNVEDLLSRYKEFSDKALAKASFMQALSAGGQLAYNMKEIGSLSYTPSEKINTSNVNLESPDMATPAISKLDEAFNSMISMARESGQEVSSGLLSRYATNVNDIYSKQAAIDADIRNKEAMVNNQNYMKAEEINANLSQRDNIARTQLQSQKSSARMNAINSFLAGIANINNMENKQVTDQFNAELLLQGMIAEKKQREALKKMIEEKEKKDKEKNDKAETGTDFSIFGKRYFNDLEGKPYQFNPMNPFNSFGPANNPVKFNPFDQYYYQNNNNYNSQNIS